MGVHESFRISFGSGCEIEKHHVVRVGRGFLQVFLQLFPLLGARADHIGMEHRPLGSFFPRHDHVLEIRQLGPEVLDRLGVIEILV